MFKTTRNLTTQLSCSTVTLWIVVLSPSRSFSPSLASSCSTLTISTCLGVRGLPLCVNACVASANVWSNVVVASHIQCIGRCSVLNVLPAGNHETDNMNQMYGFEGEVKAKYTAQMFQLFSEVFQWLPLAQCINNKVLVSYVQVPSPV